MKSRFILIVFICLGAEQVFGQARLRKMPANINHTSINNYAPYVSLDGNTLVYLADVGEDNAITMNMTVRDGVNWRDPVTLPKSVNNRLNYLRGFAVNVDGKILFISNTKSNGLGGFDLYTSHWTGLMWAEPVNMGPPANSKAHEGCPSISADGATMFFMRCEKMDFLKADGCKILMMVKKSNGQWGDPVELPGSINTGNSQVPRIMGDGETLLFSSDKLKPNKGGMDLYFSKLSNGQWSSPQPLDFANTPGDDQYVSATSLGRYLLTEAKGQHNNELVELLFPPEVRPKGTMKIEGTISAPDPSTAFVTVFNEKDQKPVFSTRPGKDGAFAVYIKEGSVYDLSVDPDKDNFTFFSKRFDLTGDKFSLLEKVSVNLKPAEAGDEIALDGITFVPRSSEIAPGCTQELRRLTRFVQGNPGKSFSVLVTLMGYHADSLRSDPDLTEVIIDSLRFPVTHQVIYKLDSIDSIAAETRDSVVIRRTYHNDRTLRQSKAIGDYLVRQGIPAGRLACSGKAEAILEERKTIVTLVIH